MVVGVRGVRAYSGRPREAIGRIVTSVLKTGQKVQADVLWRSRRTSGAVSDIERRPHIVKLVFSVALEYQPIRVWPLDQAVSNARDGIRCHGKGQRRIAR